MSNASLTPCLELISSLSDAELLPSCADSPALAEAAAEERANLRALLAGGDPNAVDEDNFNGTILHGTECPQLVRALLAAGANPNARNEFEETPLHNTRSVEIATLLLDAGAEVNAQDNVSDAPLHNACERNEPELVRLLLARGANSNLAGMTEQSPLFRTESAEVAELLLAAGADPNAEDVDMQTALHSANSEVSRVLIAHGANVMARDQADMTPLYWASDPAKIRLLKEAQATLCEADFHNAALLHNQQDGELAAWLEERGGSLADMPKTPEMRQSLQLGQQRDALQAKLDAELKDAQEELLADLIKGLPEKAAEHLRSLLPRGGTPSLTLVPPPATAHATTRSAASLPLPPP